MRTYKSGRGHGVQLQRTAVQRDRSKGGGPAGGCNMFACCGRLTTGGSLIYCCPLFIRKPARHRSCNARGGPPLLRRGDTENYSRRFRAWGSPNGGTAVVSQATDLTRQFMVAAAVTICDAHVCKRLS